MQVRSHDGGALQRLAQALRGWQGGTVRRSRQAGGSQGVAGRKRWRLAHKEQALQPPTIHWCTPPTHHVVRQNPVQAKAAQEGQPVDALLLVPPQGAVDPARGQAGRRVVWGERGAAGSAAAPLPAQHKTPACRIACAASTPPACQLTVRAARNPPSAGCPAGSAGIGPRCPAGAAGPRPAPAAPQRPGARTGGGWARWVVGRVGSKHGAVVAASTASKAGPARSPCKPHLRQRHERHHCCKGGGRQAPRQRLWVAHAPQQRHHHEQAVGHQAQAQALHDVAQGQQRAQARVVRGATCAQAAGRRGTAQTSDSRFLDLKPQL